MLFQVEFTPGLSGQQVIGLGPAVASADRRIGADGQQGFLFNPVCPLAFVAAAARLMNNPVKLGIAGFMAPISARNSGEAPSASANFGSMAEATAVNARSVRRVTSGMPHIPAV